MHVGCETEGLELAPRGEGAIEVLELRARLVRARGRGRGRGRVTISPLYLPYICPIAALYLPYICPISALYLARLDDHVDRGQRHGHPLGAPRLEHVVGVVHQLSLAAQLVGELLRARARARARG